MRLREAQIPVVLWICAAAVLHFAGEQESEHFAELHAGQSKLRVAAHEVFQSEAPGLGGGFEGVTLDEAPSPTPPPETEVATTVDSAAPADSTKPPDPVKPIDPPKLAAKKPEENKKPDEKKDDKKPDEDKKPGEKKVAIVAEPEKKIAVQQHNDKDEELNKDARFLAEKNHRTKADMQATITSLTENNKTTAPGTHIGPHDEQVGNGDKTVVREDEDRKGEAVAPNVIPKSASKDPVSKTPTPDKKPGTEKGDEKKPGVDSKVAINTALPPKPASDGKGAATKVPAAPESMLGSSGTETAPAGSAIVSSISPPTTAKPGAGDGKARTLPTLPSTGSSKKWTAGLGYGAKGDTGKPSISIDEKVLKAAVGTDELDKLRKKEGETRLSMHRGAWKASDLSRWKPAIENYVPGVKPGNTTELGTAQSPFATYLSKIHLRLHPIFAEGFIDGLDDLPATHALNDKNLVTKMEIVLRPDGTVHHLGIVKHSGVTAFDVAALDAVDRAAPFGNAPSVIVSPDGLVYLHWEFYRNEMRCSTLNAFPYLLKSAPKEEPKDPKDPPKLPDEKKLGVLMPALPSTKTGGS